MEHKDQSRKKAQGLLESIRNTLVTEIGPITISSKSPMVYMSCIEVLKYRVVELSEDALNRWDRGRNLAAFILNRSVLETVMVAEWVNFHAEDFLEGKISAEQMHECLMLATHASKAEGTPLKAKNIISIYENLDRRLSKAEGKTVKSNQTIYGWHSEVSHPNTHGAFLLYAKANEETYSISLSPDMSPLPGNIVIDAICLCLSLYSKAYEIFTLRFSAFVSKCDADFEKQKLSES